MALNNYHCSILLLSLSPWIDHLWQKSASPYFLYMPSEVQICASNQTPCLLARRPLMKISLLFICLFLKNCQVSTFNFFCKKKKKWLSPCHVSALKTFKVYNLRSWQGIHFPDTWFWRVSIFSFTCKTLKVSLVPVLRSFGYLFSYFKAAFGSLDWGVDTWKLEQMFALSMCELLAGHFFFTLKNNKYC